MLNLMFISEHHPPILSATLPELGNKLNHNRTLKQSDRIKSRTIADDHVGIRISNKQR